MDGHALIIDALEGVRLDDLAGGRADSQDAAVEVLEAEVRAAQRVGQADLFLWGGRAPEDRACENIAGTA